ncbi:MAG: bifunctional methylenetetrahydrofolate dehydrogenase/methenyltetrahydrofolate cyclohydrolase [Lactobacillus sp.]|jgi:methylenetetrahydrofolate dehydrogenase (NADP+)/methenyltetrahydrofolate cyclohydrolase|nr:bifunctional methylenetetrahydrofolate dehydrogenase/methenyltetrahydrofolate cyclohydrolase [Lactobacillus sp.]
MVQWLKSKSLKIEKIKQLQAAAKILAADAQMPTFCVIKVGDEPASQVYCRRLHALAGQIGINMLTVALPATSSQTDLLKQIAELNQKPTVHGILLTMPLPPAFDQLQAGNAILPAKDIDCLTAVNLGWLWQDQPLFVPAAAKAVMSLLAHYQVPVAGQHAVILGRSQVVGKPLAALLLKAGATVTIADSQTQALPEVVKAADLLISAVGRPAFVQAKWLKIGVNAVDVGTNVVAGKVVGDLDPACRQRVNWLTPVPGGVGPLTTVSLMEQVIQAERRQNDN